MLDHLLQNIKEPLLASPIDVLAFSVIDFRSASFESIHFEVVDGEAEISTTRPYYDLASVTKPLTNSLSYFLRPELFDEKMLLCLSHRGGLPAWGLLARDSWKDQILSYNIQSAPTLYSDFSALRVLLEFEKKEKSMKKLCSEVWDSEVCFWTDLPAGALTLQNGYIRSMPNLGTVHDPNAFNIGSFCSHAGLFGTIEGVSRTLISYQKKTSFIEKVKKDLKTHSNRFSLGWDRVEEPQSSLAGNGCSALTFGHLGFTGTSIWIDPERMRAHVILSNATKHHWFQKRELNQIRKMLGHYAWLRD
jgi:hypothetical protein